ncbi:MAG: Gfo/Idh/MocA family oxidoreductase [Hespellia sp.]|nr:Gfo/Idh/MocA family oxidoreductase [Hespellia sp.]
MNIAIIGSGNIAGQMAVAINGLDETFHAYAIASRSLEKARAFARKWNFEKAYGSYEELVADENVDLVYIATPHAMHYENAMLCITHQKAILVEKAFTANAAQAKSLLSLAKKEHIFATEAIWTRYMPSRQIVLDLLDSGIIGDTISLTAEFSYPLSHIKRMHSPELAGGALLDSGVYPLTFASMFFGNDVIKFESNTQLYHTGVDANDEIKLYYRNGKTAQLRASMLSTPKNEGVIYGTDGTIRIYDLNNFSKITVYDSSDNIVKDLPIPKQINGYEYELIACKKALGAGCLECVEMPHAETLLLMQWMDALRKTWGVIYPFEKEQNC